MEKYKMGSPFASTTTIGPLIHQGAVRKVSSLVKDSIINGATVYYGNKHPEGNFFQPTILTNMKPSMRIAAEEIFGPVAAVFPFKTEEEAIEMANSVPFGLAGYVYSRDVGRVWRVAEKLEYGMVGMNTGMVSDAAAPFGGIKESGFGREGSKYGVDEYTVLKTLTMGGLGLE
jgi:succinate-semialdehyde dehydrogenase / glutarate-semialdehyde dehydrogenase